MPKRSSKAPRGDLNTTAFNIVQQVTGTIPVKSDLQTTGVPEKNPAAVALGRLGGMRGGKARAASLSAKDRKAIAKKAALARWRKAKS